MPVPHPVAGMQAGSYATARKGGIDAYEAAFIQAKRKAGVPDSAIANMIGRPVEAVRATPRLVEPEPTPEPEPVKPAPVISKEIPVPIRGTIAHAVWLAHRETGISMQGIMGKSRMADVSKARRIAYWYARQVRREDGSPRHSLAQIGRFFGQVDHTTVRMGVAKTVAERGGLS